MNFNERHKLFPKTNVSKLSKSDDTCPTKSVLLLCTKILPCISSRKSSPYICQYGHSTIPRMTVQKFLPLGNSGPGNRTACCAMPKEIINTIKIMINCFKSSICWKITRNYYVFIIIGRLGQTVFFFLDAVLFLLSKSFKFKLTSILSILLFLSPLILAFCNATYTVKIQISNWSSLLLAL